MENLYKSLKVSWKCFRFLLVSIKLSISYVGTTCYHSYGVTRMDPVEVPAVSASLTFGCFCRVPATLPAVISRASVRFVLTGGGGMIGSLVNISGAGSYFADLFSLDQHLKCLFQPQHLTMHEFPQVLTTGRWSQYPACRSTPQHLSLSLARGLDQLRHDRAHPSLEQRIS
jgi:hypothetical protein